MLLIARHRAAVQLRPPESSPHDESIYGSFAMSDKSCVYTFREDGSGELRLSGAPYKFRFTPSGRTLLSTLKLRH
ncbi:MAG: DUF5640 domain-containing protein [Oscillospiraceae bacterium]